LPLAHFTKPLKFDIAENIKFKLFAEKEIVEKGGAKKKC